MTKPTKKASRTSIPSRPPKPRVVVKSNDFVKARYDWRVSVHRVITMMIAQLDMHQDSFEMQRINVRDIIEFSGASENTFTRMRETADLLTDKKIHLERPGEEGAFINVVEQARYTEGFVEARFTEAMRPLLLRLRQRFTKYDLRQFMRLDSIHTIRMFELVKMHENLGFLDLSIDELRAMLRLENKYSRLRDLRRYVLDKARNEMKDKTDIYFDYKKIKSGRKVTSFKLVIRHAPQEDDKSKQTREAPEKRQDPVWAWFESLPKDTQRSWHEAAKRRAEREHPEADTYRLVEIRYEIIRDWIRGKQKEGELPDPSLC